MRHAFLTAALLVLAACDSAPEPGYDFSTDHDPASAHEPTLTAPEDADPQPACEAQTFVIDVADAEVLEPMMNIGSTYNVGSTGSYLRDTFAVSKNPDEGLAVFSFSTECTGTLQISALVRDPVAGRNEGDDPDTFHVQIDDRDEFVWEFGCQTAGEEGIVWDTLAVSEFRGECVDGIPVDLTRYDAGEHLVTFRAAEAFMGTKWSALAAIEVSFAPTHEG